MKICFFYELFYPNIGGIETHIFELARELRIRGHDVEIVTAGYPNTKRYDVIDGVKITRFDVFGILEFMQKHSNVSFLRHLRRFLYSFMVGINKRFSTKYDIYHGHLQSGLIAASIAGYGRSKVIWTWHGTYYEWWEKLESWYLAKFMKTFEWFCAKYIPYDHMITADRYTKELSIDKLHLSEDLITAIPNAIRTESFNPELYSKVGVREKMKIPSNKFVIFTARRLIEKTGLKYLISALPEIKNKSSRDILLVIAGDGPQEHYLKALTLDLNLSDSVQFLGRVPHKNIPELYAMCDVVVIPSLIEATTITGIEAMAMQKPTVGTSSGGSKEVIIDNKTGYIVSPENSAQIEDVILKIIRNPESATKIANYARQYVLKNLTWSKVAKSVEDVYLRN